MEPTIIIAAFNQLREWLAQWGGYQRQKTEREEQAVRTLLIAVTKTQVHLGSLAEGRERDRSVENDLAMAWAEAAVAFIGVDQNVAPLLQLKSEAWARPDLWTDERCREAGITIEEIAALARQFLGGSRPSD